MSAPQVTVIVPVYNTIDYLRPCLESLVGQTIGHDRLEVVAIDDGSTDGSGEVLEEYAAAHPDLFRVIHQANSGGPARPCNVGLDHATGRFVFFLGSDDYLALDALERLVQRADEWDADVVVPPAIGVGGRHVDQRVFQEEHPDLAFPGDLLPFSISNTKLFRRALVEEHGLRYPLDLQVGSDQPFAVAAMLHARRISVLGPPTAYFGVKRVDQGNITYCTDWRTRLTDLTAVIDHLCGLLPEGERRDALLVRHFTWELDKLLTRDLVQCDDDGGPGARRCARQGRPPAAHRRRTTQAGCAAPAALAPRPRRGHRASASSACRPTGAWAALGRARRCLPAAPRLPGRCRGLGLRDPRHQHREVGRRDRPRVEGRDRRQPDRADCDDHASRPCVGPADAAGAQPAQQLRRPARSARPSSWTGHPGAGQDPADDLARRPGPRGARPRAVRRGRWRPGRAEAPGRHR